MIRPEHTESRYRPVQHNSGLYGRYATFMQSRRILERPAGEIRKLGLKGRAATYA